MLPALRHGLEAISAAKSAEKSADIKKSILAFSTPEAGQPEAAFSTPEAGQPEAALLTPQAGAPEAALLTPQAGAPEAALLTHRLLIMSLNSNYRSRYGSRSTTDHDTYHDQLPITIRIAINYRSRYVSRSATDHDTDPGQDGVFCRRAAPRVTCFHRAPGGFAGVRLGDFVCEKT